MGYLTEAELVKETINAYYKERDVDQVIDSVTENIVWIGTEENEYVHGKKKLQELLKKDVEAYPNSLNLRIEDIHIESVSDQMSIISTKGKQIDAMTSDIPINVRFSAVCVKQEDGNFLLASVHASTPNAVIEKHMLEQELDYNKKKIDLLMNGIPGGVAIYRLKKTGVLKTEYVSEGLARMCGYSAEEFLNLLKEDAMGNVCQEDIPELNRIITDSLGKQGTVSAMYHIHTKSGMDILNRLDANPIEEEVGKDDVAVWYAVHTVVTEDDEKTIREQEHYRRILNMMDLAFFEWDSKEGFYASEQFQKYELCKGGLGAVMGNKKSVSCIHPDDFDKMHAYLIDKSKNESPKSIVVRMKMIDGSYQYTEITGHVDFNSDMSMKRMTGILKDVNPEWMSKNYELQEALVNAEKSNQAKTDFLSRVSHDMRTPMNGILGIAKLSKECNDVDQLKEGISKIESSGNYLLGLINDTLDFQRIESGRMSLDAHPVSTKEVVSNVVEMVKPTAEQKGVQFQLSVKNADLDCYVNIDQMRMKQIFMNLISNAIKFTPPGGIVDVCFECTGHTGNMAHDVITITDNGIGMSEDFIQNKIFMPFSQEYNEITESNVGSGLGLSIVKKLVELMNGTITVESELGRGTRFTVNIDFERVDGYVPKGQEISHLGQIASLKGKNILLAEDHPLNAEIARKLLEKAECNITWAKNGQDCLELFECSEQYYYDLILMDVRMPIMGGLEATTKIRNLVRTDAQIVPIIAMTANAYDEDVKNCLLSGMNAHLAKPIDPDIMYKTIEKYMTA